MAATRIFSCSQLVPKVCKYVDAINKKGGWTRKRCLTEKKEVAERLKKKGGRGRCFDTRCSVETAAAAFPLWGTEMGLFWGRRGRAIVSRSGGARGIRGARAIVQQNRPPKLWHKCGGEAEESLA